MNFINRILAEFGLTVLRLPKVPNSRVDCPPHGILRETYDPKGAQTVFDIGANLGQTALAFAREFPAAAIVSFEPFDETFQELRREVSHLDKVECVQKGVGNSSEDIEVASAGVDSTSTTNSVRDRGDASSGTVRIEMTTVDEEIARRGISRLWLLKTDTEGFEMEVFEGCRESFVRGAIENVYVEVGFSTNYGQVPFERIYEHLLAAGYTFRGCYELDLTRQGCYANALFSL